jgi:hypothetical protein
MIATVRQSSAWHLYYPDRQVARTYSHRAVAPRNHHRDNLRETDPDLPIGSRKLRRRNREATEARDNCQTSIQIQSVDLSVAHGGEPRTFGPHPLEADRQSLGCRSHVIKGSSDLKF